MGKGYKRKTRWRTLDIGAPPGEEDEEDGIRNGYTRGQENSMSSKNGQPGHKSGRTNSVGSTTSDYASDYASVVSRSRRYDSACPPSQPKVLFNEDEYTRITTPRQDVLFKKGYLSRKTVSASTASTSATPSTTESQSASHSTADGSETTEDQQLLDCKENGAEEYPATVDPGAQVAYGTFYDHASGYYYEYPVMVVGPGAGMPGPVMQGVLTTMPCGPVPLRPIQWINPAFVPKLGNQQYCVMDCQTAPLAQYSMLDENHHVSLIAPMENTNGSEEPCCENGTESITNWADVVDSEENAASSINDETQNGTAENSLAPTGEDEPVEAPINSEDFMETALAQQLQVTHVAVPPLPQPYMYPGHYMFGPSLVNVNGVTVQCGPMVRNTGVVDGSTNVAKAFRRRKRRLNKRHRGRTSGQDTKEDEEQAEEDCSSEAENVAGYSQKPGASGVASARVVFNDVGTGEPIVGTGPDCQLNPECQEFRPVLESRIAALSNDVTFGETASYQSNYEPSSNTDSSDNNQGDSAAESLEKSVPQPPPSSTGSSNQDSTIPRISESAVVASNAKTTEKHVLRLEDEVEAAPIEFAAEVFANVTNIAERAMAPRNVVEGTPMETEVGVDVTSLDFKDIIENSDVGPKQPEETGRRRTRIDGVEEKGLPSGPTSVPEERSFDKSSTTDVIPEVLSEVTETISGKRQKGLGSNDQRGSRSASPGMINRTTTPINAMTQRLPESYESLVTRVSSGSSCAVTVPQTARNRKYSAKAPKFVREATPGPDLDAVQHQSQPASVELGDLTSMRKTNNENGNNSEQPIVINAESPSRDDFVNDNEPIATGIDAIEAEVQRYSLSTTGSAYTDSNSANKRDVNADASNEDSGIEIQSRFSSDRPITNAVTEWLRRANSPELFVTSTMASESEPEDDELEDEEPSKNLQGNPMPALSANSNVNGSESSRLASGGKFARVIDRPVNSTEIPRNVRNINNNNDIVTKWSGKSVASTVGLTGRKRRAEAKRKGSRKSAFATKNDSTSGNQQDLKKSSSASPSRDADEEAARQNIRLGSQLAENKNENVCEFTEKDSAVGMRVAESTRTKIMRTMMMLDSCKSRVDKSRRLKAHDESTVIMLSSRDAPVENVDVKVRRLMDDNDEGIVEDEEVSVRTFEKGQIVVSIAGKVLPVAAYEPILLQHRRIDDETASRNEICQNLEFSNITCEKSRCNDDDSTLSDNGASKRNSLGSIEEPDVLECWEVETVEPLTTPKRQARGTSLDGEAAEDDAGLPVIDPAAVEIVRKYYRLEAMRNSVASVTSVEDDVNVVNDDEKKRRVSLPNSPERMIESLCSEEIPVIGERLTEIVEKMLTNSGIPVEEAVEVYESCYSGKTPSYLLGFDSKFRRNGSFHRLDSGRNRTLPCKAACCNIQ